MSIFIVNQIGRYYTSIHRHSAAKRMHSFAQHLETQAASYQETAEILGWLQTELNDQDSEARYWLDCVKEICNLLWERENPPHQPDRLEVSKVERRLRGWDKRRFKDMTPEQLKVVERFERDGYSIEGLHSYRGSQIEVRLVKEIRQFKADVHTQTDYARITIDLKKCGKQIGYRRHRLERITIQQEQSA